MEIDYPRLLQAVLDQYVQKWQGTHGISHWARVWENGLRLRKVTGAHETVIKLFAVFHDSRRINEGFDHGHGRYGAKLAKAFRGRHFELPDEEFNMLYRACEYHTDGQTKGHPTIQTCWDADRLDLGRVSIIPDPEKLCTDAARKPETTKWALERSEVRLVPDLIKDIWGLDY